MQHEAGALILALKLSLGAALYPRGQTMAVVLRAGMGAAAGKQQ